MLRASVSCKPEGCPLIGGGILTGNVVAVQHHRNHSIGSGLPRA